MSKENVWTVVGRSRLDLDFNGKLLQDFDRTLTDAGYKLDNVEIELAKKIILQTSSQVPPAFSQLDPSQAVLIQQKQTDMLIDVMERRKKLTSKMHDVVEQTFDRAAQTYYSIALMNKVMFVTGITLFIFSAFYTIFAQEKVYSLVFGGLGIASFITLFLLGPIEKTQNALSNLVQVEIVFMSFFDQIVWWEQVASIPRQGNTPSPDINNIERASQGLQECCRETIEMLESYVEQVDTSSRRSRKPKKAFTKTGTESAAMTNK